MGSSISQPVVNESTSTVAPVPEPKPHKEARVPMFRQFVRTLDVEGGVGTANPNDTGVQFFRIESRYLDPDVNAFVGMLASMSRFNEKLRIGEDDHLSTAHWVGNWGVDIGIVRGKHLWAVDLMGGNLGNHLGFAPALVGEHNLGEHFKIYHRTIFDLFMTDPMLDSDQGIMWNSGKIWGLTLGYRIVSAKHMNRSGPRVGILLHFNSPKIPFIFPSLG